MSGRQPSLGGKALNRAIQALPLGARRRVSYLRAHHRPLSLAHPVRYSEKLNWRMVHDRRALIATMCDKLAMQRLVLDRLGADRLRIPRTYWTGTDVDELASVELPAEWVLKPNFGTGQVHFGSGAVDLSVVRPLARRWFADKGLVRWGEWGYGAAQRVLLAEERIGTADLWDWKFFVFDGAVAMISVDTGRFGQHRRRLYTADWEPLPHRTGPPLADPVDPPDRLDEMLAIARELGAGLDHVRVDLYLHDGQLWFGELTPYSGSGMVRFEPDDLDVALGDRWTLPSIAAVR